MAFIYVVYGQNYVVCANSIERKRKLNRILFRVNCKCQYKNAQKVENKNVHFPVSPPQIVSPKRLAFP